MISSDTKTNARIKLSTGNSKTGKCLTFNLPAGPAGGCNPNAPCWSLGLCYACKGRWLFANVRQRLSINAAAWQQDPAQVEYDILDQSANYDNVNAVFRWFSSGDIVNLAFMKMMIRVAIARPGIRFLCFTKKYNIVNAYIDNNGQLPDNLAIIFSYWQGWDCYNPHNMPAALVTLKGPKMGKGKSCHWLPDPRLSPTAKHCPGSCEHCHLCWTMKPGDQVYFMEH